MPPPNQIPKLNFEGISATHQQWLNQLTDAVNTLIGHNGPISLASHLDLGGHRIQNVGAPQSETDALPSGSAEAKYSAAALALQIKPGARNNIPGYRQVGNQTQREPSSSFLNDLMSSVPSANRIIPVLTNVTGGVEVYIPSSPFTFSDGSTINLLPYHDNVSYGTSYSISSIACVGNVVTVITTDTVPLVAGDVMTISGVTPAGFNGSNQVTSADPLTNTLTYEKDLGAVSGSGGSVEIGNIVYYFASKRSTQISRTRGFTADTAHNRLQSCYDGNQIVAVVVIGASGAVVAQSGGGGSPLTGPPASGSFF